MILEPIHIHIFFAQFPVALAIFGLLLFLFGLARKAEPMLETAFYAIVSASVASIFAFFSGRFLASVNTSFAPAGSHSHLAYLAVFLAIIFSVVVLWLRYLPRRKERYFVFIFLIVLSALFIIVEFLGFQAL